MEETTLFNHQTLGTAEKPLIPNEIFKETLESLNQGELEFYELVRQEYTFEAYQKGLLEDRYNKITGKI